MPDEPSLGEVLRRLDAVATQLTALTLQLRDDRIEAAATYLRRDLYLEQAAGRDRRIKDLEEDRDEKERESRGFRRQLIGLVLALAIPAIGGLLISITIFLATQGQGVP